MIVRRLKDRLRSKFNVAVAETDHQELWQRAVISVTTVARTNSMRARRFSYRSKNPSAALQNASFRVISRLCRSYARRRVDRIEEQLRIELSEILAMEVQDPRVRLVTVTHVKVSPDYATCAGICELSGRARRTKENPPGPAIGRRLRPPFVGATPAPLERTPELTFDYDDTIEKETRIEKLLDQIRTDEK
jgi:ribosome-binding factor A